MSDLQVVHLDTDALLQVGDEFGAPFRDDEVDAVIEDEFGGGVLEQFLVLEHPDQAHDEEVGQDGHQQRTPVQDIMRFRSGGAYQVIQRRQAVHGGEGDDDEQVGHLPDGYGLGPVPDYAEDGEQAQGEAHAHFHVAHDVQEHEHGRGEHHEGEEVVAAPALAVVEQAHDDPAHEKVQEKADGELGEALRRGHHCVRDGLDVQEVVVGEVELVQVLH